MTIEKQQIIGIQSAMSKRCSSRDERLEYISNIVGRKLSSTKDLTKVEADELLHFLNVGEVKKTNWGYFDLQNVKHRVLLSHLYTAGWVVSNLRHGEVPDTERLSNFLKSNKSPVNKPLKKMDSKEVEKVITAFIGIVKATYK
ncbi:hypothetical protein [Tenacibaculum maritimum]|uniref:hypothetical protein n=1 Tax=Tenacibaculum maritimum TaxID=107401 RepID=UPI0012E474DB|nr:hypothetical protein [Tenacibaculum maritimum]CAA0247999.1 conserved hypothetical protein [Tenacibaculum maritimum]